MVFRHAVVHAQRGLDIELHIRIGDLLIQLAKPVIHLRLFGMIDLPAAMGQ